LELGQWRCFFDIPPWCRCQWQKSVGVKARVVNRKHVDVAGASRWQEIVLAVLECANCSLNVTVGAALGETVETVSLSTVPRLSLLPRQTAAVMSFANGEATFGHRSSIPRGQDLSNRFSCAITDDRHQKAKQYYSPLHYV